MATVSEVVRFLGVDRDAVKRWATRYAEHLSPTARPVNGRERQFTDTDLRALMLVAEQTEMGANADEIDALLHEGRHHEEPFLEFSRLHCPLFRDPPEKLDETWQHGALIGGMARRNLPLIARAYKLAADELVKQSLAKHESHELDYPILFLYRHTVELYLKAALVNSPEHHDLGKLIQLLEEECGNKLAGWINDRLWDFHQIDLRSDMFRYPEEVPKGELWIDFHQLQTVIAKLVEAFEQYMHQTGRG